MLAGAMTEGIFHDAGIVPEPGEIVIRSGFANFWRGPEAVGGKLWLTSRWLIFKSHAVNIQTGIWALPLTEIAAIAPVNTLKIVPNGLEVTLRSGEKARFVVNKRQKWIEAINAVLSD